MCSEHARTGDRALLRHVADEDHDHAALLGEPRQLRRAFAHLRDAARRRLQRLGVDGLDRIDDHDLRLRSRLIAATIASSCTSASNSTGRVDEPQPLRAQRNLLDRLFAGDVERAVRGAQRGAAACSSSVDLPMPGIAADQHHAARHAGRRPARGRIPRGRWECAAFCCGSTAASDAIAERVAGHRLRSARPRASPRLDQRVPGAARAGTGPATWAPSRRIRCRCRRFWLAAAVAMLRQFVRVHDGRAELADHDARGLDWRCGRRRGSDAPAASSTPKRRDDGVAGAGNVDSTSRACAGIVSAPSAE